MDTKKLSALLKVIELGSLTSAADILGYTQPGLTNMMNSLEAETGLQLLIRNKTGVRLSPAGRDLLPQIERLVEVADEFEQAAVKRKASAANIYHVGAIASVARAWMPTILAKFVQLNQEADVHITSIDNLKTAYDAVRNGELDCALVSYQPDFMKGLSFDFLQNDELCVILPNTYESDGQAFPVGAFAQTTFLMPSGGFDADMLPVFERNGYSRPSNIRLTNLDDAAIVSMVQNGLGVTVLSDLIMKSIPADVTILPLSPAHYRRIGIITREGSIPKNLKAFTDCVEDTTKDF